jgi:hypothetical protein
MFVENGISVVSEHYFSFHYKSSSVKNKQRLKLELIVNSCFTMLNHSEKKILINEEKNINLNK